MKKYFLTGLVILLPLAVTVAIVAFIINFLTDPFVGVFEQFFEQFNWYPRLKVLVHVSLQIVLLFSIFFLIVFLGFLTRLLVFKYLLQFYDYIMHRIPFIKSVYKTSQQIIKTIFGTQSRSFKEVVLVPFPTIGGYCIGLVSSKAPILCEEATGKELISVFVPTTPNPTSGYLIMYDRNIVQKIDMKIDDAFKYIISCGVLTANESFPVPPPPQEK
ncbi:MAG: DUF502 domain-containing protein [Chlamydiia bacterium]|nr:DUF502 domain-containing protein [Chlamydiia bacterium]